MKTNVIKLNILHLNTVRINGRVEMQGVSLQAGEIPEPPVVTTYTLAANVSNGKVTATKNGTAISLPYVATEGDVIVLSVTSDEGYEFKGWLDGNKSNPRTVTMTDNVVLSASCVEIAKPTYTLSASVTNGKVSAKRNGSAVNLPFTANEGDTIVVSVTPNDGYAFEGWNDGNTDNPRSITMNADVALSAQCVEVVQPPVGNYIQFEDAEVERVLMANGVSSDGVGITKEDAERVTSIGTWFKGNTAITSFKEFAFFKNCTSLYGVFNGGAFYGCTNLVSIILPSSLAEIMQFAFQNCSALANVEGLENVVNIGQGAFAGCPLTNVEELHLASLEGSMSKRTFNGMSHSHRIVDLGKITAISATQYNDYIFGSGATYLRLPSTIESISSYAFNNLTKLETIICEATTPPTIISSFNGSTCPIYVPDASLEAYKTAVNWSAYADRIKPLSELNA